MATKNISRWHTGSPHTKRQACNSQIRATQVVAFDGNAFRYMRATKPAMTKHNLVNKTARVH